MVGSTYLDFDKTQAKALKLIRTGENPTFGLLVIVGINLGLRISDLLQLKFGQLKGMSLTIVEGKTKKNRQLMVNQNIHQAMEHFKEENDNFYAFRSQKGSIYSSQHVNRLMKQYFKIDDVSSHSLRKTFGRRVWDNHNQSEKALLYLSELFNHTSITVTRKYLGIRQEELDDIYLTL
jgi:integrase